MPGEPVFFRLKSPWNAIAGYGYFADFQVLDLELAWREGVAIFPSSHAVDSSLAGAIALVVSRFFTSFAPDGAGETIRLRV